MATGGSCSPSSREDKRESLTCSVCLGIFTQPKLLPCSHTFCLKCLENLTSLQTSPTFPCPYCRSQTTIPSGGVSAFQDNYYIHPEDLYRAQEGAQCLTHPKQDLDLYCVDCQLPVCLKCVLTKHKPHDTQDLSEAAAEAKKQLNQDEARLQQAMSLMTERVEEERTEQQAVQDKKAAVKTAILNRHATVVAMADKFRDEQLASLDKVCAEVEKEVSENLATKTLGLQELRHLQQRLEETHTNSSACAQVTLAKEMREGKGSPEAIMKMTSAKRSTITRPVLSFASTPVTLLQKVRNFFGNVDTMKMAVTPCDVKVVEKFTCRKDKDTEVYSLCPLVNRRVLISYAFCGLQQDAFSESFDAKTGALMTSYNQKAFGKTSQKARDNGRGLFLPPTNSYICTLSKSVTLSNEHPRLCNNLNGNAEVRMVRVTSEDPLKIKYGTKLIINVGPHRAFDMDSSKQNFAIVEEPQEPDQQRQVKLYQLYKPDPVATYASPSKPFNPSDVCFFTLRGQEVLAIADEVGDSIHVVRVQDGAMTFLQHLAPGCPLLVQPTALNINIKGQLWVACRGGRILTMSPITVTP